jgi:hypothetical protein
MAETQREQVPRVDSGELDTAVAFLSFARHCVLKKADGLSDEQLRRVLVDCGTSILGLVQHLAEAERYWFGYHLVGAVWDAEREYGMAVLADRAVGDVLLDYRAAIEDSDRAIHAVGDPGRARRCRGRRQPAHAAVGHGPHDERDRPARRTRGHPPGTDRRHHRSLSRLHLVASIYRQRCTEQTEQHGTAGSCWHDPPDALVRGRAARP